VAHCECGRELDVSFEKRYEGKVYVLEPKVSSAKVRVNTLINALSLYWRWRAEGDREFKKKQHYYDHDSTSIGYDKNSDSYRFSIKLDKEQVWEGRCRVDSHGGIKVLEEGIFRD
jgi:hypothetical protein